MFGQRKRGVRGNALIARLWWAIENDGHHGPALTIGWGPLSEMLSTYGNRKGGVDLLRFCLLLVSCDASRRVEVPEVGHSLVNITYWSPGFKAVRVSMSKFYVRCWNQGDDETVVSPHEQNERKSQRRLRKKDLTKNLETSWNKRSGDKTVTSGCFPKGLIKFLKVAGNVN